MPNSPSLVQFTINLTFLKVRLPPAFTVKFPFRVPVPFSTVTGEVMIQSPCAGGPLDKGPVGRDAEIGTGIIGVVVVVVVGVVVTVGVVTLVVVEGIIDDVVVAQIVGNVVVAVLVVVVVWVVGVADDVTVGISGVVKVG